MHSRVLRNGAGTTGRRACLKAARICTAAGDQGSQQPACLATQSSSRRLTKSTQRWAKRACTCVPSARPAELRPACRRISESMRGTAGRAQTMTRTTPQQRRFRCEWDWAPCATSPGRSARLLKAQDLGRPQGTCGTTKGVCLCTHSFARCSGQRSSTKMFLGHLEATTGLDFDGDGKVVLLCALP